MSARTSGWRGLVGSDGRQSLIICRYDQNVPGDDAVGEDGSGGDISGGEPNQEPTTPDEEGLRNPQKGDLADSKNDERHAERVEPVACTDRMKLLL